MPDFLFENFPSVSSKQWKQKIQFDLKGLEDWEIGQVLFPWELGFVEINTGLDLSDGIKGWSSIALNNVSYNEELGKSPQEWLRDIILKAYDVGEKTLEIIKVGERKNVLPRDIYAIKVKGTDKILKGIFDIQHADFLSPYQKVYADAMLSAHIHHSHSAWPNSGEAFEKGFYKMIKSDEGRKIIYLIGFPDGFRADFIVPITISGQTIPQYTVLCARELGIPAYVAGAVYPMGGLHEEPYIRVYNIKAEWDTYPYFGFWLYKQPFIEDYKGYGNPPRFTSIFKPFQTNIQKSE